MSIKNYIKYIMVFQEFSLIYAQILKEKIKICRIFLNLFRQAGIIENRGLSKKLNESVIPDPDPAEGGHAGISWKQ